MIANTWIENKRKRKKKTTINKRYLNNLFACDIIGDCKKLLSASINLHFFSSLSKTIAGWIYKINKHNY